MHSKIHLLITLFLIFLSSNIANAQEFNVLECSYGSMAACDESTLSDIEKTEVQETRSRMNVLHCSYSTRAKCNESALTSHQRAEVQQIRSRMNALHCSYGSESKCNESALTDYQRVEVQEARSRTNAFKCSYGSGVNCNNSRSDAHDSKGVVRTESVVNYFDEAPERLGCAENGSCHGDISEATFKPKTVHVEGYRRSDGTYVRGHYRSK